MTQEVITLQFGPTACFVGAHFWNLQEASFRYATATERSESAQQSEADHDALFRVGEDSRGRTTYTPRLVVCDRWSSAPIPTVSVDGYDINEEADESGSADAALATAAATVASRGLPVEVHPMHRQGRHRFQRQAFDGGDAEGKSEEAAEIYDESSFRVWNDCLGTRLHPRSVMHLSPLAESASQIQEDLESRLRLFAEECDCLQGFHLLADAQDPVFGGSLAVSTLAHLAEEFAKKTSLVLPCFPHPAWVESAQAGSNSYFASYRLNSLLTLVRIDPLAGLIVAFSSPSSPTPAPWISTSSAAASPSAALTVSQYASTAAAAAWLDTVTLPTRLRYGLHDRPDLADIQRLLCQANRRFCCPSLRLYRPDGAPFDIDKPLLQAPPPLGPFLVGESLACLSVGRSLPCQQQQQSSTVVERWLADIRAPGAGHLARHFHLTSPALTAKSPFPPSLLPSGVSPSAGGQANRSLIGSWAMLDNSSGAADSLDHLTDCVESGRFRCVSASTTLEADELQEATAAARDIADRYRPDRVL